VYGNIQKFQEDPNWKDYILFHEYFHGDTGAGVGASHQTGWTGTIARTMHLFATMSMDDAVKFSKAGALGTKIGKVKPVEKTKRRKPVDGRRK